MRQGIKAPPEIRPSFMVKSSFTGELSFCFEIGHSNFEHKMFDVFD